MIGSEYYLCSEDEVRKIAGFNALQDVGSEEIETYISDATQEIYEEYGDYVVHEPVISLQAGSAEYEFDDNDYPIYKTEIAYLEDDTTEAGSVVLDSGSYSINNARGIVTFTDDIHQDYDGKDVTFELIPSMYNLLAKNIAGFELLSNTTLMSGEDAESARLRRIGNRINKYKDKLNPYTAFRG